MVTAWPYLSLDKKTPRPNIMTSQRGTDDDVITECYNVKK